MMARPTFKLTAIVLLIGVAGLVSLGHLGCGGDRSEVWSGRGPMPALPADRLVLLITGDTNGNLEPCNCPGQPRGGLSRRKTLLDSLRKRYGPATVLLDNGNSVLLTPEPITDRYIWAGMVRLGYDAMAVGDQELDRGPRAFAESARQAGLPLVATNVKLAETQPAAAGNSPESGRGRGPDASESPLGPAYRLIERGGKRVLVLSVIGPRAMHWSPEKIRKEIDLADPAEAVARTLAEVRADPRTGRVDVVVLLAVLDPSEREEVVSRLSGVDLAVLSTTQDHPVQVEKMGQTPVVFAAPEGRQVVAVAFAPDQVVQPPAGTNVAQPPAAVSRMHIALAVGHPVELTLARDKGLWDLYQSFAYDDQQRRLKLLEMAGKVKFVASADCGSCHVVQYEWWLKHKHGSAWATIQREGRTADGNCMRCHTTGYGYLGGFRTVADAPRLANVGCQCCHQVDLAANQVGDSPRHAKPSPVSQLTCHGCHTVSQSPDFNWANYGPKATCPKGKPVLPATQPN